MKSSIKLLCALIFLTAALPPAAAAWVSPRYAKAADQAAQKSDLYRAGQKDLDAGRWTDAAAKFDRLAGQKGPESVAALYWKAYAQHKAGRGREALASLQKLASAHPKSPWADDARALEVEIRGATGGKPRSIQPGEDDELKLYALNGLMASDSRRALPLLLKFLDGNNPPRLKEQALFILSQSDAPEAQKVLIDVARGSKYPALQGKAIESLGIAGDPAAVKALGEIYASTEKPAIKSAILEAYLVADAKGRVLAAARDESNPALRRKAIEVLGAMEAMPELRQLYRSEAALRPALLDALGVAGDVEALITIARDGKEAPALRREATSKIGLDPSPGATAALRSLYADSQDPGIRRAVLDGLFLQDNAEALIAMFRSEKNPALRREIVQKLSLMDSEEALDFLAKTFAD